jgi:hypothetical protein
MCMPAIVEYGRLNIDKYNAEEFRRSLFRAFKERHADFITLDNNPNGQRFLAACMAWAISEGLLHNDRNADDGQQVVSSFRLTEKGKVEILGQ